MAIVNITTGAKLVKKTRQTLYSHHKKGDLAFSKMDDGNNGVDTSELERVYGKLYVTPDQLDNLPSDSVNVKTDTSRQSLTAKSDSEYNALKIEVERLREQINSKDEKTEMLTDQIEDLRRQRDEWQNQAKNNQTLLLTHDQQRAEKPKSIFGWLRQG